MHIAQADPDATVAILPCDHYYSDESALTQALESAFEILATQPRSVVLLGAQPNAPECEYGWIEIGAPVLEDLFQVRGFHEKPSLHLAECLLKSGALWNTFVMVGHVDAFLQMGWATAPGLLEVFQTRVTALCRNGETQIPDSLYDRVSPVDFSRQVLSPGARHLVALRLGNMEWHDLGDPDRVLSTLVARNTDLPPWAKDWQAERKAAAGATTRSQSAVA